RNRSFTRFCISPEHLLNPVIDQLRSHRSIRKYTSQPIDEALFLQLIEAGQSSATSSFLQGATIIRVRNPEKRSALAQLSGNAHVSTAAEFLVFCADLRRAGKIGRASCRDRVCLL